MQSRMGCKDDPDQRVLSKLWRGPAHPSWLRFWLPVRPFERQPENLFDPDPLAHHWLSVVAVRPKDPGRCQERGCFELRDSAGQTAC